MKKIVFFIFSFLFAILLNAQIKVACIGNSITYGHGLNRDETYPAQLQKLLGADWNVQNFGVSGRTLLSKGDLPYILEKAYADAKAFQPDIAVIMLGTNDAKPHNWQFNEDFIPDYTAMIDELQSLPSKPLIIVCMPVPAYGINFRINDSIVNNHVVSLAKSVAKKNKAILVDLHKPLANHPEWFPDKIHPDKNGAGEMANVLSRKLLKYKKKLLRRKKV